MFGLMSHWADLEARNVTGNTCIAETEYHNPSTVLAGWDIINDAIKDDIF
jgi:hypothetical protein